MAEFRYDHKVGSDYDNQVTIEVRVKTLFSQEDYQELVGAVDTIDKLARKYVEQTVPVKVVKNG